MAPNFIPVPASEQLQREAEGAALQALEERLRLQRERDLRLRAARIKAEESAARADTVSTRAPSVSTKRTPPTPTIPDVCPAQPFHTVAVYDWCTATQRFRDQACGDMHVANFGVFVQAERQLVFAINDLGETRLGPWEWDVKRLATSAFVASHHLRGNKSEREAAVRGAVEGSRSRMRLYAGMGQLEVW